MRIEADAERSFTVPVERLWPLVTAVHGYLDTIAEVVDYETDAADRTAAFDGRLAVGPVVWTLVGTAAVAATAQDREVSVSLTVPKLVLGYQGRLLLEDLGGRTSRVSYDGVITCEHKMVAKLQFLLRPILVDHVELFLDKTVGQAERAFAAEQALLGRRGGPRQRRT